MDFNGSGTLGSGSHDIIWSHGQAMAEPMIKPRPSHGQLMAESWPGLAKPNLIWPGLAGQASPRHGDLAWI